MCGQPGRTTPDVAATVGHFTLDKRKNNCFTIGAVFTSSEPKSGALIVASFLCGGIIMNRTILLLPFAVGLMMGSIASGMGLSGYRHVSQNHSSPRSSRAKARPDQKLKMPGAKLVLPGPNLTAEQVVRIQMHALQHNDVPSKDSGIATTFRFASPQNQQQTGPLDHFILIVKNPTYAPMLNCRSVAYGELKQVGEEATETVSVTAMDGSVLRYVFLLSRQAAGPFAGCWMNDGCVKVEAPEKVHRLDETRTGAGKTFAF